MVMAFLYMVLLVLVLLIIANVWFMLRVFLPLRVLAKQSQSLTQGHFDALKETSSGIGEVETVRYAMDCMVGHVRRAQEQGKTYAEILANGQEAERARIARELHDNTVQSIVAISQSLDMAVAWIQDKPDKAAELLKMAHSQAVESIYTLRDLIADLRPPALEELGLVAALEMQAQSLEKNGAQLSVTGHNPRRLNETHELVLFRSAQEAINNARRHGHATHIDIHLDYGVMGIEMKIQDNGSGFQTNMSIDQLTAEGHYGLLGIRERVDSLNGRLKIASTPNQGTTLTIWIPYDPLTQPSEATQDPVCHAIIQPQQAYGSLEYEGTRYYFCCPVCQGAFQKNPTAYLTHSEYAN